MLSNEQIGEIKKQIINQIESTFPAEQIQSAKSQIESMNAEQLESFLERNNLVKGSDSDKNCVFCSIVSGDINSAKLDENDKAIAVLEINPISEGHSIIIPKEHTDQSGKKTQELAEKVAKNIKEKLKPKKVEIAKTKLFGHEIINVVPVYENETLNSERKQVKKEELELIQENLKEKPKKEVIKKSEPKKLDSKKLWLPRRIP